MTIAKGSTTRALAVFAIVGSLRNEDGGAKQLG